MSETINDTNSLSIVSSERITTNENLNESEGDPGFIYYLNNEDKWIELTGKGTNITAGDFDYTYAEGCAFLVNQNSNNRYIESDGITVKDSTEGNGHLFSTPPASKINYYKGRLYLADYIKYGNRYKTTILRSSYSMGLAALLNADYTALASGSEIEITDTKYFYSDSGANTYDIYRGETFIKSITVTNVGATTITATWDGTLTVLASDEIWVSGTYEGKKVFRWFRNSTITGSTVKQYDTFKLSGGENDPITLLTNIGNVMIVGNRSALATWNDYTLENFDLSIGCVSKRGYTKMLGTLYFLDYTGVYATSGGTPTRISNKIEKYITGATREGKENSAAGKKGGSIFFTLGDVTLYNDDGSINKILKDVCIEYNIIQETWYVHTNIKATEFTTFIDNYDTDRLLLTDYSGNCAVKEFLKGETDDGVEIPMRLDTMKFAPGLHSTSGSSSVQAFEYLSHPIAVIAEVLRGASLQVYVNIDDDEYYPLEGNLKKGLSILKVKDKDNSRGAPPSCRLISLSIRDNSKQLCKLSRLTLVYIPTSNEEPDNE